MGLFNKKPKSCSATLMLVRATSSASMQDLFSSLDGFPTIDGLAEARIVRDPDSLLDSSGPLDTRYSYAIVGEPESALVLYADAGTGFVSVRIEGSAELVQRANSAFTLIELQLKARYPGAVPRIVS